MGKAVVCNDLGDLSNFKDYTFNFQTENFKQFNDNILQVLNNDIDTKKVIEGQQYIKRNFSWEKIVAEFNKTLINRLGK
jgi:glycosyltransferase involved in cell wall biosynthesis